MKISVELNDEDRAKLLKLASEQPGRGLADLVGEAIAYFVASRENEGTRKQKAEALRGSLTAEEAEEVRQAISQIRSSWR